MPRYIDASKIHLTAETAIDPVDLEAYVPLSAVRRAIAQTPTADVQEVRHAQWWDATPPRFYACSYCGGAGHSIYKFCPWCGAEMDGGGKDSGN